MPASSFRSRQYAAIGGLMTLVCLSTATAVFGIRAVDQASARCRHANETLIAHLNLSNNAEKLFSEIKLSIIQDTARDLTRGMALLEAVRGDILTTRKAIALEFANMRGPEEETLEFDQLDRIERAIEDIAETYVEPNASTPAARDRRAYREKAIADLNDPALGKLFDEAIAEERREVDEAEGQMHHTVMLVETIAPLIGLATLALAAMLLFYFNRVFLSSLRRLSVGATALARGEFEHAIPSMPTKEFEDVRRGFEKIGAEFKLNRAELQSAHDRLESEVRDRTAALEAAKERLEDSDRARRNFFADISHELRTPLTVIRGEAEIALRGSDKSSTHYQDSLSRIAEQARHTNRLIDDLLFVARADSGAPRLDMRSVAVCALMGEVMNNFRPAAAERAISLSWKCRLGETVVLGDRGRLRQALSVIVDNAVRYSHRGGEVRATCRLDGGRIEIAVDDDGVGIMKTDFDRVFERYYRGGNSTNEQDGLGLGLPVAKAIVEAHKGEIRLTASASGGVTATIALPVESELRAVS